MTCVVCEHCQGKVLKSDVIAVRDGYSYHNKCYKCYVCSETNLLNAEIFKGVIFCYSCSQRIFQGCSTARKSKNGTRTQSARTRRPTRRQRSRRRHQERRTERSRTHHTNGVIELTCLAGSTDSDSYSSGIKDRPKLSDTLAVSTELALQGKLVSVENSKSIKKDSAEMGMTTEVTQELLRQMNCPVVTERNHGTKSMSTKPRAKEKAESIFNKTIVCSDLRIAELGASTEIAHMALRKRSEVPVIIKSESNMNAGESLTLSGNQESDATGDGNEDWLDSSVIEQEKIRWLDRSVGSILKMPYKFFKKKILDRSSLITVLKTSDRESRVFLKQLKVLFHEEIVEHQHRGVKRLYSTINRRKTPYKLGWLNVMAKVSAKCLKNSDVIKNQLAIKSASSKSKMQPFASARCKHFNSHSYRCMRAQVMRLAGPTKSELAALRNKLKEKVTPKFVRDMIRINKKYSAIMMSQACGSDVHGGSTQTIKLKLNLNNCLD